MTLGCLEQLILQMACVLFAHTLIYLDQIQTFWIQNISVWKVSRCIPSAKLFVNLSIWRFKTTFAVQLALLVCRSKLYQYFKEHEKVSKIIWWMAAIKIKDGADVICLSGVELKLIRFLYLLTPFKKNGMEAFWLKNNF